MQVFLQGHTTERYCLLGERGTVVCFRIANIFKTHLRVIYYVVESLSSLAWIMRKKSGCFFYFRENVYVVLHDSSSLENWPESED